MTPLAHTDYSFRTSFYFDEVLVWEIVVKMLMGWENVSDIGLYYSLFGNLIEIRGGGKFIAFLF